ncbi:helix-turn-helix domain-containing protein [Streptococcus suis]
MFPKRLTYLRKEAALTQKEIARHLNIKQPTYAQWENARTKPSAETLEKFADFFDVSTDYLLGRTDIPNPYEKSEFESLFDQLNDEQKEIAIRFLDNLIKEK